MSVLFSILELNEIAFMFLTIASTIISFQIGSYIISLFRTSFIYSNSISPASFMLAPEKDRTKCETWSLEPRSLYFKKQKNETTK